MLPFLISFLVTTLLTPVVIALAWRAGWVAQPRKDRWHARPTALMGGTAIFLGTVTSWLIAVDLPAEAPVVLSAAAAFLLGVLDDRLEFRPYQKLIGQATVGAILIAGGIRFGALPVGLALPLTLLWVVGITNAINYVDNMDGLAAGGSAISALCLAAYCMTVGNPQTAGAAMALAGGCAGFLIYNVKPAKIFMGDCGSLFVGYSLAALAVQTTHGNTGHPAHPMLSLLVPPVLLAFPIFDIALVSVVRTLRGGSPLQRGWESCSYRLVALGLSERTAVLLLYGITALFGGLALASTRVPPLEAVALAALAFLALGLFGAFLELTPDRCPPRDRS